MAGASDLLKLVVYVPVTHADAACPYEEVAFDLHPLEHYKD
jgi:hypothetical protein